MFNIDDDDADDGSGVVKIIAPLVINGVTYDHGFIWPKALNRIGSFLLNGVNLFVPEFERIKDGKGYMLGVRLSQIGLTTIKLKVGERMSYKLSGHDNLIFTKV